MQGIAFADRETGWAVGGSEFGFGSALLHTLDGGMTWTSQLENVTGTVEFGFFDIAATTGQHAVAVGAAEQGVAIFAPPPLIVVTDDAGAHWRAVEILPHRRNGTLRSICLTSTGAGIAVGYTVTSGGIVVTTTNGGASWTDISDTTGFAGSDTTRITSTGCAAPARFWISGVNIGFVGAGAYSNLLYSPDGGATWSERTPDIGNVTGRTFQLLPLAFATEDVGWTLPGPLPPPFDSEGISPFILRTSDAGDHWDEQAIPEDFHGALTALAFVDDEQGVAVGTGALTTADGGRAWQTASFTSSVGPLLDVAIVP